MRPTKNNFITIRYREYLIVPTLCHPRGPAADWGWHRQTKERYDTPQPEDGNELTCRIYHLLSQESSLPRVVELT